MSVTKFTPGPWFVPHFARPEVNCPCQYVLCDHLMGAVASVHCSGEGYNWQSHGDNPRFGEAVANAYLIAAAPRLYAALGALLDRYLVMGCGEGVEALEAKYALQEARGEQS
jgi:hypothetical protein